ncbi:MAG: hypothetical protein LBQ88_12740 [Treponema sp.]|nr:hypothetical protein [Treponema sp.]
MNTETKQIDNNDYLEKVFVAIEEANKKMKEYGVTLDWSFKIAPYYEPVTKEFK